MPRLVYMGTPDIASQILEKLCSEGYRPELVVTQTAKAQGRGQKIEKSNVGKAAEKLGLSVIETDNVSSGPALEAVQKAKPDVILVVAFGQILRDSILSLPKIACLNVHASLLPKYRGAAPVQRAIWNGDKVTGVTIQKMVKKLDAGDILLKKETPINSSETSGELLARLAKLGGEALVESVRLIESGKYSFTPQMESEVTQAPKISKEDGQLDWSKPSEWIQNQVRALQPWPVAETVFESKRLKVFKTLEGENTISSPGTCDTDHKTYLKFACGDGKWLSLLEVQPDNKKRMGIGDFLRGLQGKENS